MNENIGYLIIRAFEAQEAMPVPNAKVSIFEKKNDNLNLIKSLVTGVNGETEKIQLPSKSRDMSLAPNDQAPYTTYDVKVELPGYYTKYYVDLPIFPGNTSIQKVPMIPLPNNNDGVSEIQYIIEKEPSDL